MDKSALFLILEADPGKYINKRSSTVLVLLKLLECALVMQWIPAMADLVRTAFSMGGGGSTLTRMLVDGLLPASLEGVLPVEALAASGPPVIGSLSAGVYGITAAAILVTAVCMVAESVALILVRFLQMGAVVPKYAHKAIYYASIVLFFCGIGMAMILIGGSVLSGVMGSLDLTGSALLVVGSAACLWLLKKLISYHKDVAAALAAVEYEIRMEFKETTLGNLRINGLAFLFAGICLVLAVVVWFAADVTGGVSAALAGGMDLRALATALSPVFWFMLLAFKYLAVSSCWSNFRLCHM